MLRLGLFVTARGYGGSEGWDAALGDLFLKPSVGRAPVSGYDLSSLPTVSQLEKAASRREAAGETVALVDICRHRLLLLPGSVRGQHARHRRHLRFGAEPPEAGQGGSAHLKSARFQ